MRPRFWLGLAVSTMAIGGCRHKERLAPVEFAAEAGAGDIDAEASLAPGWPAPVRADLDNGAVMHWLRETGTPALHLRLLVPLGTRHSIDAATATVVATAVRLELSRRVRRHGATVDVAHGPGRVEIVVHGHDADAETILDALTQVISERKPERMLLQAQAKAAAVYRPPDASARATAGLVAGLLGVDPIRERTDRSRLVELDEAALERAWFGLLDPREAVIVVHAGRPADALTESIRKLAGTWTGKGRRPSPSAVVDRVRTTEPRRVTTRILTEPAAALGIVDSESAGGGVLMLGRVIPTPTARDRAYARLTQRLLQEEVDARLLVSGEIALLSVQIRLSKRDPAKAVRLALGRLDRFAATEHQPERMRQAARLWLGARMIEASLDGEDWTALWSESIDLASKDADIAGALARDAHLMLDADADSVRKWQEKWLRPRGGEPGWIWVAAGVDAEGQRQLAELGPIARLE